MNTDHTIVDTLFKIFLAIAMYFVMRKYSYSKPESITMPVFLVLFPPIFFLIISGSYFGAKKLLERYKKTNK